MTATRGIGRLRFGAAEKAKDGVAGEYHGRVFGGERVGGMRAQGGSCNNTAYLSFCGFPLRDYCEMRTRRWHGRVDDQRDGGETSCEEMEATGTTYGHLKGCLWHGRVRSGDSADMTRRGPL